MTSAENWAKIFSRGWVMAVSAVVSLAFIAGTTETAQAATLAAPRQPQTAAAGAVQLPARDAETGPGGLVLYRKIERITVRVRCGRRERIDGAGGNRRRRVARNRRRSALRGGKRRRNGRRGR